MYAGRKGRSNRFAVLRHGEAYTGENKPKAVRYLVISREFVRWNPASLSIKLSKGFILNERPILIINFRKSSHSNCNIRLYVGVQRHPTYRLLERIEDYPNVLCK